MEVREIVKARTTLLNAGTTADRNQLRETLLAHLAKDIDTLGQQMATVRSDYRRKLERWRTQEVPENVAVCALPSDMHDSRLYRVTGVFALLCEMALAALDLRLARSRLVDGRGNGARHYAHPARHFPARLR
jgi:hypothetical protein